MNRLAVIPAKGHSTRLPGKNLAPLGGRPLIEWTIAAARDSGLFAAVVVSTDDADIAAVARAAGADVPFTRSPELTRDGIEVDAVVRDAVRRAAGRPPPTWVCTLQPTSPLRRARHIVEAWRLLADDPAAEALVAVSPYDHLPQWALAVDGGVLHPVDAASCTLSRSVLPERVHPNGCMYWQKTQAILAGHPLYAGRTLAYRTPPDAAVDIDEPQDLAYAEWLLSRELNDPRPDRDSPIR